MFNFKSLNYENSKKKLEDFECKKVEINSIYGGTMRQAAQTSVHFTSSCTVGGANSGCDDGPCDMPD